MNALRLASLDLSTLSKNWGWFLVWGIALVILGAMAISAATLTTMISVIFLGALILLSGSVILVDTFVSWWGRWSTFLLHFIVSLLYIGVGLMMITTPAFSSVSLTLLLGVFYVIVGFSRLGVSSTLRLPRWEWGFFNGIVTLLLGILILLNWPASSLYIIGLFVGIDLVFCGMAYIMTGLSARAL